MGWVEWLGVVFGVLVFLLALPFHSKCLEPTRPVNDLGATAERFRAVPRRGAKIR